MWKIRAIASSDADGNEHVEASNLISHRQQIYIVK